MYFADFSENNFTALAPPTSGNKAVRTLRLSHNRISTLDLSKFGALRVVQNSVEYVI